MNTSRGIQSKSVRPTVSELAAAAGRTIRDLIKPELRVLFCGINPGLYSAWAGHHFARPGNRFWPALFAAGFSDRLLHPSEQHMLLERGYGITNLVARSSATAAELTADELITGGKRLLRKAQRYQPHVISVLGVTAYRAAFAQPKAVLGRQEQRLGPSLVWVLPNPSGLNAHFTPADLARVFKQFRSEIGDGDA